MSTKEAFPDLTKVKELLAADGYRETFVTMVGHRAIVIYCKSGESLPVLTFFGKAYIPFDAINLELYLTSANGKRAFLSEDRE